MNFLKAKLVALLTVGVLSLTLFSASNIREERSPLTDGELHVGEGYEFPSIQMAVDAAAEGATVVVHEGEYHERVLIKRGITLMAAPGESFHLAASPDDPGPPGTRGAAVTIASPTPVTISGGSYSYSGTTWNDAAIKIQYGQGHTIQSCVIYNSQQGIWVHGGDLSVSLNCGNVVIADNTIMNIRGHGIYLQRTSASVYRNTISLCGEAIMVAHGYVSTGGGVWRNTIHNSTVGIFVESDKLPTIDLNAFADCSWGIYLNGTTSSLTLRSNRYDRCTVGIFYRRSAPLTLIGDRFYNCSTALQTDAADSAGLSLRSCGIYGSDTYAINITGALDVDDLTAVGPGGCLFSPAGNSISIRNSRIESSGESIRVSGPGSIDLTTTSLISSSRAFLSEGQVQVSLNLCNLNSTQEALTMNGGTLQSSDTDFTSTSTKALLLDGVTGNYIRGGNISSGGAQVIYLRRCADLELSGIRIGGRSGGAGLFLRESERISAYDLTIDGNLSEGIIITGEGQQFIRHTIGEDNTFGGRPIFYIYGESGEVLNLTGKGEVIIAGTADTVIREEDCSPGSTWILGSRNVTLLNSTLDNGLHILESDDVRGEDLILRQSHYSGSSLLMVNSTLHLFNSTLRKDMAELETFYLSSSSHAHFYNTTFEGSGYIDSSILTIYHLIGLKVLFSDGEPAPGAEYRLTLDDASFRSTPLFSGTSPPTDEGGMAGPWWIPHLTYDESSITEHNLTITVNVTADRFWQEERPVNTSYDHLEIFRTSDIRAPQVPTGVQAAAVEGKDEILISWNPNQDDTVLYRVYLIEGAPLLLGETSGTSYRDVGVENGTVRTYAVSAVDEVGLESNLSPHVTATARDYIPPERPPDLWVVGYGGTNATLLWSPSPSPDTVLYRIYMAPGRRDGGLEGFVPVGETAENLFEVTGLLPETEYTFTVLAYDEADNPSPPSPMRHIKTLDITWPTISNLTWSVVPYVLTVEWDTDQPTTGTLYLGTSRENMKSYREEGASLHHKIVVEQLEPDTTYYFWVYSEEPSGNSVKDDRGGDLYTFTTPPFEGYMKIEIRSSYDGSPVTGASVRASGRSGQVGITEVAPGVYSGTVEPGTWTITINAEGFISLPPFDVEISLLEWTNLTVNMTPVGPPPCNLSIRIVDSEGRGIEGARVIFEGQEYTSDAEGRVHLGIVDSNATYTLTVSREGYRKKTVKVEIPYGEDAMEERVTLEKEKGGGSLLWLLVIAVLVAAVAVGAVMYMRKRGGNEGGKGEDKGPGEKPEVKKGSV